MSAAFASCRTASHPVSTTGENAIRSTPWVMKVLMEEICLAWSPSAEVNCRSTLYCSADDLMESVLALRQPLSEPTWAKPITAPSSIAGSTGGSSPPASAEPEGADDALALLVAALLDEATLVDPVTEVLRSSRDGFGRVLQRVSRDRPTEGSCAAGPRGSSSERGLHW